MTTNLQNLLMKIETQRREIIENDESVSLLELEFKIKLKSFGYGPKREKLHQEFYDYKDTSFQEYSSHLKKFIGTKYDFLETEDSGILKTKSGKDIIVKISMEDAKGGFNFVQLRPYKKLDYYKYGEFESVECN